MLLARRRTYTFEKAVSQLASALCKQVSASDVAFLDVFAVFTTFSLQQQKWRTIAQYNEDVRIIKTGFKQKSFLSVVWTFFKLYLNSLASSKVD